MTRVGYTPIRVRKSLAARLAEAADERGVSMVWLTNRLLAEGMDRLVPADQLTVTASRVGISPGRTDDE